MMNFDDAMLTDTTISSHETIIQPTKESVGAVDAGVAHDGDLWLLKKENKN